MVTIKDLDAVQDFLTWIEEKMPRRRYSREFLFELLGRYRDEHDWGQKNE